MASYLFPSNKNVYCLSLCTSNCDKAKVYLIGLLNVYSEEYLTFDNLDGLILYLDKMKDKSFIYVHDLKFDYAFIYYYLKSNNIDIIKDEFIVGDEHKIMEVSLLVNEKNIYLRDFSLLVNGSVEDIFTKFAIIKDNHLLWEEFLNYKLIGLAKILRKRLSFSTHLTTSGAAKRELMSTLDLDPKERARVFPNLDYDTDQELRPFYRGGYCYLNPIYKDTLIYNLCIIDKNSMYGFIMNSLSNFDLPCGIPIYFDGKPSNLYKLYCVAIRFRTATLKHGMAFVRDQSNFNTFTRNYNSFIDDGRIYYFTNYELELFLKNYFIEDLEYLFGYYFKSIDNKLFDNYINKYYDYRLNEYNKGLQEFAKLMINAPSGKFGEKQDNKRFNSFLNHKGVQDFEQLDLELSKGFYLPMAIFITACARYYLLNLINSLGDDFIYCDTDSVHFFNFDKHKNKFNFGNKINNWKIEGFYVAGKYLKQKIYMVANEKDFNYEYTIAGVNTRDLNIDFQDFKLGMIIPNKRMEYCKGGAMLKDFNFRVV